jgi:hypothetical protein
MLTFTLMVGGGTCTGLIYWSAILVFPAETEEKYENPSQDRKYESVTLLCTGISCINQGKI